MPKKPKPKKKVKARRGEKRRNAKAAGFRSGWEQEIEQALKRARVEYEYEAETFTIHVPKSGVVCDDCGSKLVSAKTRYTPDWFLGNGVIVESKGRFTARDRKIAIAMKEQHGDRPVRLLFRINNKLSPKSKTRYSDWCDKNGIAYAIGPVIPAEWTEEE